MISPSTVPPKPFIAPGPPHECVAYQERKFDTHKGMRGKIYVFVLDGNYMVFTKRDGWVELADVKAGESVAKVKLVVGEWCEGYAEIKRKLKRVKK